jgi:hypothetical protein
MTMPTAEDQISLAEIVRTMKDFREEFRGAISTMMRTDVYRAEQATLRAEITASQLAMEQKITALRHELEDLKAEKRQKNGIVWGAFASGALALVMSFFTFNR